MQLQIRRRASTEGARWQPEHIDAALYGASALFALLTIVVAALPLYRQWAKLAIGPYLAGAVLSLVLAEWRRRRAAKGDATPGTDGFDAPGTGRNWWRSARALIFLLVLVGATLVPLALEVMWRSDHAAGSHVQPEVSVVEHAGHRAAHGKDPYQLVIRHGHEVVFTPGEPEYENFFPYGPVMSAFGLPSSTRAPIDLTDARIFFSAVTLAVTLLALWLLRGPRQWRIRSLQVLTVLPTAALPLATGGDDMPVVAFLLLAMVLAQRRRPFWSGLVLGVVSAMKFTAWPLAGLALFAAYDRSGRRRPGLMALGLGGVLVPSVLPFVVNDAPAFLENVVLYPLGLAGVSSPAASALPGHLLVQTWPSLHKVVPLVVLVLGGAVLARHLWRHPPASASDVCGLAAVVMTVAIVLAPATRVGYLLYPVNFAVWAAMFRAADAAAPHPADETPDLEPLAASTP
jgi:hypothetical protein